MFFMSNRANPVFEKAASSQPTNGGGKAAWGELEMIFEVL